MATPKRTAEELRRAELGKIHLWSKQLGLDDDTYRDMLWTVARVRSARDLDEYGRRTVLDHLRRCGAGGDRRPKPADDRAPMIAKIRAMLRAANREDAYADGIAAHMFKIARYDWCNPDQLRRLVAALAIDARRRANGAAR